MSKQEATTQKCVDRFSRAYLKKAMDSGRGTAAVPVVTLLSEVLYIPLTLQWHEVSRWNLSRSELSPALTYAGVASLVRMWKDDFPLQPDQLQILQSVTDDLWGQLSRSKDHLTPIDWSQIGNATPIPSTVDEVETPHFNEVPAGSIQATTVDQLKRGSLLTFDDLAKVFEPGASRIGPEDFDRAISTALNTILDEFAQHAEGPDQRFKQEIGNYLVDGYILGRRLLDTHMVKLEYSTPGAATRNATRVLERKKAMPLQETFEYIGETASGFMGGFAAYQSQFGLFGELGEESVTVAKVTLMNGLRLAIAENELFGG